MIHTAADPFELARCRGTRCGGSAEESPTAALAGALVGNDPSRLLLGFDEVRLVGEFDQAALGGISVDKFAFDVSNGRVTALTEGFPRATAEQTAALATGIEDLGQTALSVIREETGLTTITPQNAAFFAHSDFDGDGTIDDKEAGATLAAAASAPVPGLRMPVWAFSGEFGPEAMEKASDDLETNAKVGNAIYKHLFGN